MSHVATVTIDHLEVSADLTDFVVFVNLADLPASFWDVVANGGGDIRCYKADGTTPLPREVVSCDTATDTGELHVKYAGVLSSSVDTEIQIHADGTSSEPAFTDTYGRNAVWSSAQTVLLMEDSTPIDHTGTHTYTKNGAGVVTEISGPFGDALSIPSGASFSNTDTALKDIPITHDFTVSVISRRASYSDGSNNGAVLSFEGTDDLILYPTEDSGVTSQGARAFWRDVGGSALAASSVASINVWQWSSVTSRSSNDHELYVNGNSVDSSNNTGTPGPFVGFYVGAFGPVGQPFIGDIAQVIVWKSARNDAWIATEYANQSAPASFYTATAPATGAYNETASIAATATVSATEAYTAPAYDETASVTATPTVDATETFGAGAFDETASIAATATVSASETYTAPAYDETASVTATATVTASEVFTEPGGAFNETADISATATVSASESYTGPAYSEAASITFAALVEASEIYVGPGAGETASITGTVTVDASETWEPPHYSETASIIGLLTVTAVHTFSTPSALPAGISRLSAERVGGFFAERIGRA